MQGINDNPNDLYSAPDTDYPTMNLLREAANREQQIIALIESAPFPIAVYIGREMRISRANRAIIEIWGKGPDLIGKTFFEVLPELKDQNIYSQLEQVYDTGIPLNIRNKRIDLMVHGKLEKFYFNYSFTPLFDAAGMVYGIMNTAADVTDLNLAKQSVEFSEQNFRNIVLQSPVAMCLLKGPNFIIELANSAMIEMWDKSQEQVTAKPVLQVLTYAKRPVNRRIMTKVYQTGEPYFINEQPVFLTKQGKKKTVYQNFSYQPYRNGDGKIIGILSIAVDVTCQVNARMELEKIYEQIQLSKTAAQLGTFDMNPKTGVLKLDNRCRELFGIEHQDEINYETNFSDTIHPDDRKRVTGIINNLLSGKKNNGDYDIEYRTIGPAEHQLHWIRAKGKLYYHRKKPIRFIGSVFDITEAKQNELRLAELAEKQAQLAAIVNSSDDIIISKTLAGIITSWNPAAERAFGYSSAEAIGAHISIIIPKKRLAEEDFIIAQIKNGKKVDHFETIRIGKDLKPLYLSITVSPVIDVNGNIIGASKIARDISQKILAEKNAKRYTERLEIMNMVISEISTELELNKILQKVTNATTELTGAQFGAFFYNKTSQKDESYIRCTVAGAPQDLFEKTGLPLKNNIFRDIFSNREVLRVDDVSKHPNYNQECFNFELPKGLMHIVSFLAVPVVSRSGHIIGGLFFGHQEPAKFMMEHENIAMSIAAQAAISLDNATLFEEVKTLNDKKDEFIGLASHELKTPLASISGYLQIINRTTKDEQSKKFLNKAYNQVERLTSLINDLLDISKIEAGKLLLSFQNFDIKQVIEEAIELIQHSTNKHTITLNAAAIPLLSYGDPQRIEQVVINLINNAIKYAPAADRVDVELKQEGKKIMVSVTDYGPGIPTDKLTNIFTRFYRIDESSPNVSGLGIGLYLSHEIITRHKGEIWVESEPGNGSTFFFTLPYIES